MARSRRRGGDPFWRSVADEAQYLDSTSQGLEPDLEYDLEGSFVACETILGPPVRYAGRPARTRRGGR